jgi:hypothetical protein
MKMPKMRDFVLFFIILDYIAFIQKFSLVFEGLKYLGID